jgi:outer membrane protein TolC
MRLRESICAFLAVMGSSFVPLNLRAQSPSVRQESVSLTLDQAIDIALGANPELLAIASEIAAARGRVLVARSLEPPQLALERDEISGPLPDAAGTTRLELEQGLPFPGKRALRGQVAELEVRLLQAEERRIRRRLVAGVKEGYYLARFELEKVRSLEASAALLEGFLETTKNRFEAGRAPYLDVIRAKVELSRLRNDLLDARRESVRARADLNLLLGRSGNTPLELLTPLVAPAEEPDRETTILRVERENARVEAAMLRLESARAARQLAGKERLPDISFRLAAERLRERDETTNTWGTAVGIPLPLWWWKAPRGAVLEADAKLAREAVDLAAAHREARTAAEQAFESVATTRAQLHLFESSILDDIETELRSGIDTYRTGQVDALNLIDIYRTYIESRTEYSRSIYQYLAALARLEAAGDIEP